MLALFDLDKTLINTDTDNLWISFLVEKGFLNKQMILKKAQEFDLAYKTGTLNINNYVLFVTEILSMFSRQELEELLLDFSKKIRQIKVISQKSIDLVNKHKLKGHYTIITTATNDFIVKNIVKEFFNIDHLITTKLEIKEEKFTGKVIGIPNFQEGKIQNIKKWLKSNSKYSLSNCYFYSDSLNDLPLLKIVSHPVVVDGEKDLITYAKEKDWSIISLKDEN